MKKLIVLIIGFASLLMLDQVLAIPLSIPEAKEEAVLIIECLGITSFDPQHLKTIVDVALEESGTSIEPKALHDLIAMLIPSCELNCTQSSKNTEFELCAPELWMPSTLINSARFNAQQLIVPSQLGTSCGSHTIINAKCFENCLKKNHMLPTSQDMSMEFEQYRQFIKPEELEIIDMVYILQPQVELQEAFYLGISNGIVYPAGMSGNTSLFDRIREFKNKKEDYMFFACNTGGHWVLLAVTKGFGAQPTIFYMNSINRITLEIDKAGMAYIAYLQRLLT